MQGIVNVGDLHVLTRPELSPGGVDAHILFFDVGRAIPVKTALDQMASLRGVGVEVEHERLVLEWRVETFARDIADGQFHVRRVVVYVEGQDYSVVRGVVVDHQVPHGGVRAGGNLRRVRPVLQRAGRVLPDAGRPAVAVRAPYEVAQRRRLGVPGERRGRVVDFGELAVGVRVLAVIARVLDF